MRLQAALEELQFVQGGDSPIYQHTGTHKLCLAYGVRVQRPCRHVACVQLRTYRCCLPPAVVPAGVTLVQLVPVVLIPAVKGVIKYW